MNKVTHILLPSMEPLLPKVRGGSFFVLELKAGYRQLTKPDCPTRIAVPEQFGAPDGATVQRLE